MTYVGDFVAGATVYGGWNTRDTDGAPITLDSGTLRVYRDDGDTEDDSGITLDADSDTRTGWHRFIIDTSQDGTFYAAGHDFFVLITVGTVDSVSVVGVQVGHFSIENRNTKANLTQVNGAAQTATLDTIKAETASIVADTDELQTDWANGGRLDLLIDAIKAVTDVLVSPATIATAVWATATRTLTAGTNIVLAKGTGVTGFNDLSAADVNAQVDMALADYDGPTHAELVSEVNAVQADIAALPTASENADAVHDEVVDGTRTLRQLARGWTAVLLGKVSGMDEFTPAFRNIGDTKDVVTASTDSDGNRETVTLDLD